MGSAFLLRRSRVAVVALIGGLVWTLSAAILALYWMVGTWSGRLTTMFFDHGVLVGRVGLVALLVTMRSALVMALRSPRR
ncbi:hypothetical protein [Nocardioides bruguierae]|uniref:Uncharacterized protein n=1 Tax=Nocardioides bruguierae TaxID=2945102 RepID=A0A9X2DBE8_9ACTN|nr:hypothetical protein [Nocardioides bruguierae]MCM0622743.1 hypothetical protein [Nocardioides bruguierae]